MNRLKELRLDKNITLKHLRNVLVHKYGVMVTDGQLSLYENGKRSPRNPEIWESLADYFGVSVPYLLGYNKERPTDLKLSPATIEAIDKAKQTFNQLDKNKQEIIELVANYDIAELVEKTFSEKVLGEISKLFNLIEIYFSVEKNYSDNEIRAITEFRENLLTVIKDMFDLAIKIGDTIDDNKALEGQSKPNNK